MNRSFLAEQIVAQIIEDFTSRSGLEDEWDQIDKAMQAEIKKDWKQIVTNVLDQHL